MRILFSGLVAAGLLVSPLVTAAEQCTRPADKTAFDVEGLKSELMVTALSCNQQSKYNAFITRFHTDIGSEEKALSTYFARAYGRGAQKAHDDYITQLANVQSSDGLKAGTAFCERNVSMFDEVQALRSSSELSDYVAAKDITQPVSLSNCTEPEHPTHTATVHRVRATVRHTRHH